MITRASSTTLNDAEKNEKRTLLKNITTKVTEIADWNEKIIEDYRTNCDAALYRAVMGVQVQVDESLDQALKYVESDVYHPLRNAGAMLNLHMYILDHPEVGKTYTYLHPRKAKKAKLVTTTANAIYVRLDIPKLRKLDQVTEQVHAEGYNGVARAFQSVIDFKTGKTDTPAHPGWDDYVALRRIVTTYNLMDLKPVIQSR